MSLSVSSWSQADSICFTIEEIQLVAIRQADCNEFERDYNALKIAYQTIQFEVETERLRYVNLTDVLKNNIHSRCKWRKARILIATKL